RLGYQQLFLAGRPAVRRPMGRSGFSIPDLQDLEWCFSGGKIYFRCPSGTMPDAYDPTCCGLKTGITLYYVRGVIIRNLVVQAYQIDGINAKDVASPVRLENVICRGNGRAGIAVAGASLVEIDDSIIGDNGEAQLLVESPAKVDVRRTDLV